MSDKQLAVRSSSSATGHGRNISPHDDLDLLVDQLLQRNGQEGSGTVDDILRHPQVKKHGMLGRLSSGQQSLVTSVVSLMQDRVASDARKNTDALKQIIIHEREALSHMSRSFAETAKHLYQLPLLGRAGRDYSTVDHGAPPSPPHNNSNAGISQPPMPPRLSMLERFLTWGNLLAGTAVVLAVLVVKTSVETASYETQYRLTQESLEQTRAELEKAHQAQQTLVAENKTLAEQNASLNTRVEAQSTQMNKDVQRLTADLQAQARQLDEARQTITRQQRVLAEKESSKTVGQERLNEQISVLQQQLAALKGKESQQGENTQMWKQLAEERKQEIAKLQAELKSKTTVQSNKPIEKDGFLGLF